MEEQGNVDLFHEEIGVVERMLMEYEQLRREGKIKDPVLKPACVYDYEWKLREDFEEKLRESLLDETE